jgi:hypothetical protein
MTPRRPTDRSDSDHDLLIRITERLEGMQLEIRDAHKEFAQRFERLEREKSNYGDLDVLRRSIEAQQATLFAQSQDCLGRDTEQQKQINKLNRVMWLAVGALAGVEFLGGAVLILVQILKGH